MNREDFFAIATSGEVNEANVAELTAIYGTQIPDIIKRIVSHNINALFLNEVRIMSLEEIKEAEHDLHVDFVKKGFLPIADCGDNDFIIYHLQEKIWSKYNIVDDVVFKRRESLEELIK